MASSVAEARLAREELGGEVHAYAPAYSDLEMAELITLALASLLAIGRIAFGS